MHWQWTIFAIQIQAASDFHNFFSNFIIEIMTKAYVFSHWDPWFR